jgi:hypothetical protein
MREASAPLRRVRLGFLRFQTKFLYGSAAPLPERKAALTASRAS